MQTAQLPQRSQLNLGTHLGRFAGGRCRFRNLECVCFCIFFLVDVTAAVVLVPLLLRLFLLLLVFNTLIIRFSIFE